MISYEFLMASSIGVLVTCGIYLILRSRTFPVVLGLTLISYAVYLFMISMGRLKVGAPPILGAQADYIDPLPQGLVLTAIVIGFAMTAFAITLAVKAHVVLGNDHVDGQEGA